MGGAFNFRKFAKFLNSFWGILAAFTVALPTIIYFLNTNQIKSSVLGEYYIAIPTTFSLLVIPFIFLYEDKYSVLKTARKTSIIFISLSFVILFSFLIIKSIYISDRVYIKKIDDITSVQISENKEGLVQFKEFESNKPKGNIQERINRFELLSLCLFSLSIIFLTTAFSGLGLFYYTRSKT